MEHLERRIEESGMLKLDSDQLLASVANARKIPHCAIIDSDFEVEPVHLGIISCAGLTRDIVDPDRQDPVFSPPEHLVIDSPHIVKDLQTLKTIHDEVEIVTRASTTIFHPDDVGIVTAAKVASTFVPLSWAVNKDIYPYREIIATSNFARLKHSKRSVVVLPDRRTFIERMACRYPHPSHVFDTWYEDVLKYLVSGYRSLWAIEFCNDPLHSSRCLRILRQCLIQRPSPCDQRKGPDLDVSC